VNIVQDNEQAVVLAPDKTETAWIIWLHGLGADGHDFVPLIEQLSSYRQHCRFIFPNAPKRPITINAGMVMRGWYDILALDISAKQDKIGLNQSRNQVFEYIKAAKSQGIAPKRIILAGFSQGGAVALYAGLSYPQALGGILALSTYLPLRYQFDEYAKASRKTPIFMGHGSMDEIIPLGTAESSRQFLQQQQYALEWHTYPMAHSLCADEIQHLDSWLQQRIA